MRTAPSASSEDIYWVGYQFGPPGGLHPSPFSTASFFHGDQWFNYWYPGQAPGQDLDPDNDVAVFDESFDPQGNGMPLHVYFGDYVVPQYPIFLPNPVLVPGGDARVDHFAVRRGGFTGSGEQLRTVPIGAVDTISITFPLHVAVEESDLSVHGTNHGEYAFAAFGYDAEAFTASWTLTAAIGNDAIALVLSDGVATSQGAALDGEWDNPTDLLDSTSSHQSGDGAAGGEFEFHFTVLPGDANRDNQVTGADYTIWADHFDGGQGAANAVFGDGDFNGDGFVTGADYTLWADRFGLDQTTPPVVIAQRGRRESVDALLVSMARARTVQPLSHANLPTAVKAFVPRHANRRVELPAVDAVIAKEDWQNQIAENIAIRQPARGS